MGMDDSRERIFDRRDNNVDCSFELQCHIAERFKCIAICEFTQKNAHFLVKISIDKYLISSQVLSMLTFIIVIQLVLATYIRLDEYLWPLILHYFMPENVLTFAYNISAVQV